MSGMCDGEWPSLLFPTELGFGGPDPLFPIQRPQHEATHFKCPVCHLSVIILRHQTLSPVFIEADHNVAFHRQASFQSEVSLPTPAVAW